MNVLVVSHYSLPHVGGIEVLLDQLGRVLVRQGHRVTVVSSRDGAAAEEERDGVRVLRVAAWNGLERRWHVPYPIFAPSLVSVVGRAVRAADVVHAHGVLYLGSLCALFWAWWWNKPLVLTEHVGFVPYRNAWLNRLQRLGLAITARLFLRRADAVITYNTAVHDWLRGLTPHPERLHFVRNGVDVERFRPAAADERRAARQRLGIDCARPLALFVGRFVEKKGLDELLRAVDGSFELLLCGRGELPFTPAAPVHILRDIEHEHMPEVYRAADVFVLPSRGEGFPVAMAEAMASGLPVVAARDPTYDTYVSDVEMVQTSGDAASVRAALLPLLADDGDRVRRAAAARACAERNFSLAAWTTNHLSIYGDVQSYRRLRAALAPLSYDLATRIKLPVLRQLLGESPPRPRADIGPGSGYGAHAVFSSGPIIAIDISGVNLSALQTRARTAGCPYRFLGVQADLSALPLRDGALGTILCTEVLEHLADDHRAAAELSRVLAPGGRLVAEVPHIARGYASYLERLGVTTVHDVPGPEFHHRPGYTADGLAELFRPHGLRITRQSSFVGWVGLLLMDSVALVHLLYERLRFGRAAWTWADVRQLTDSPVFRVYRWLFPVLYAVSGLDALVSRGVGFVLAMRLEKPPQNNGHGPSG